MSLLRPYQPRGGHFRRDGRPSYGRNNNMGVKATAPAAAAAAIYYCNYDNFTYITKPDSSNHELHQNLQQAYRLDGANFERDCLPSSKRRKVSGVSGESSGRPYHLPNTYQNDVVYNADQFEPPKFYDAYCNSRLVSDSSVVVAEPRCNDANAYALTTSKRDRSTFEDEEVVFLSRDEIERCSPSRKDGIDPLHEMHLRYSYCAFLQNLGIRLDLPQTTIGTAMVLCHRFFLRRSHACHDRFLIATAVLFLAAKSEETPRPLNDVLRVSCEITHKQDFTLLSYMFPIDWFEQYRERITEAEQLILTTLNFELNVQHPYESLTTTLQKIGFSQSMLMSLALNLVSEGVYRGLACSPYDIIAWRLRSSLWLQFKPQQIAAGAAYLAAKFLNMDLASCHNVWNEFHTPPSVLKDVAHQLMELF